MRLTGQIERKFEYNTSHAYEENIKALAAWKQWWSENRSKFAESQPAEPQPASAPASAPAGDASS
jgi:hypothetical protein